MVRAGLLVGIDALQAAEALVRAWQPTAVWGMSPFGGSTTEAVWDKFDPRVFVRNSPSATPVQAALRVAFALPAVEAIAVGTDNMDHLRELKETLEFEVDDQAVSEYRQLLRVSPPEAP